MDKPHSQRAAILAAIGGGIVLGGLAGVALAFGWPITWPMFRWPGQSIAVQDAPQDCPAGRPALDLNPLDCLFTPALTWVGSRPPDAVRFTADLGPDLAPFLRSAPWPEIAAPARLAQVPVLMYHDILTDKQVFFDITTAEFEGHLQKLQEKGFTAISLDQLVVHLKTGLPLPTKPVLLTFDDGYVGHYEHVYPLLKKYNMPGVFSIFPGKVDGQVAGRSTVTWVQLKTMAADPLVTIASHSVTHPADLRAMDDASLERELVDSKARLEAQLGIPIQYFTYPAGHYDDRVMAAAQRAGYLAALTMRNADEQLAGASKNLLAIERIGQSRLATILDTAWGGPTQPTAFRGTDFSAPVAHTRVRLNDIDLVLVSGGQATTIHADTRYAVAAIKGRDPKLVAAVDGGFFSLKSLDSNVMIGPVLSRATGQFIPGGNGDNPKLTGRPLVLISPQQVMFVPFDPTKHNTLAGIQQVLPEVTDAFVSSAWLVREGVGQPYASFGNLFGFDAYRHRAFWGVDHHGRPVIGISTQRVDSPALGQALALAGFRTAVMLDSGASADLAYLGKSVVSSYEPRPVPHIVGLWPPPTPDPQPNP